MRLAMDIIKNSFLKKVLVIKKWMILRDVSIWEVIKNFNYKILIRKKLIKVD